LYSGSAPTSQIPSGSAPSSPSSYGSITIAGIPLNYNGNPNFSNYAFIDPEAILDEKYPKPPEPVTPDPVEPPAIIATANPPIGQLASTEPPGVVKSFFIGMWSGVHNALDIAGLIPIVGEVADGANALIYFAEGDNISAGISVAAMTPVVGIGATTGKAAKKVAGVVGDTITKHADEVANTAVKTFKKASSRRLAKNLEEAGIPKPSTMKNPEAHHDLPEVFQDDFNRVGLDIDEAQYGRWVEGAEKGIKNEGKHQNWSYDFNKEWKEFLNPKDGTVRSKEEILKFMEEIRKRYPPPIIQ
jgi:hypothetical protein